MSKEDLKNIKLIIAYKGTNFKGWQKQNNTRGIQGELERACEKAFKKDSIEIIGSGRTDAGVHAMAQVANFIVESNIPIEKYPEIINRYLPDDIAIVDAEEVDMEFHSRYLAHRKTYKYMIYPARLRNPFYNDISYHVRKELDFEKMKKSIKDLEGEHDFRGFMSTGSSVKTSVRRIYRADIYREGELIVIEVEGSGFLYNMVRIIAGTLVDIGKGKITESLSEIIKSGDRKRAGHTAPAQGLFLKSVDY
ncbi:pseudouridine synthase [Peptostreptococcus russellii]|uniref:tRNA pseudouridine synthase A n=1 Tax=Peptostreptococcus russellii TaxID=215200 RepID=A0A2P7PZW3_9FIRM|nr:tRNA pseudouridine(38-40) synthase TruA [Peptostreptococcus russellii]PSJ31233.1 pseudouridine synthase [Peptostreptococcus russellii]